MAGNLSLTSTISSLPESVTINYELNLILGSGLAALGSLGILSLLTLITTIIVFKNTVEASYIIILSFALCDIGHLSIVVGHVAPELILKELSWAWGLVTLFRHSILLFWYSSLGHFCLMAINRYYAVCRPMSLSTVFSVRRTWQYCTWVWSIAFLFCVTPLTGFLCCRKIFDIHHDAEEEEDVIAQKTNALKIITVVLNWLTVTVMILCYTAVFKRLRIKAGDVGAQPRTLRQ
ncbi:MAG: G-protein coupled receptor, partial [Gammaproteobacteria bacterium]|nr:G-protein coupled receptor [Gammaproteobacteria bacterium]